MTNKAAATRNVVKLGVVPGGRRNDGATTKPTKAAVKVAELREPAPDGVVQPTPTKDYFVERNGVKFAGTHLLVELWGASNLGDVAATERAFREGVEASGATLLHMHFHHFGPNAGLSGVAVLAESHISIHTWPERGYAAIDIFMCGACDPYQAVPALRRAYAPTSVQISEQKRGVIA